MRRSGGKTSETIDGRNDGFLGSFQLELVLMIVQSMEIFGT